MTVHYLAPGATDTGCGIFRDRAHSANPAEISCFRPGCRKHAAKVGQPRRIALVIAPATATHCAPPGSLVGCRWLNTEKQSVRCDAFERLAGAATATTMRSAFQNVSPPR